MVRESLKQPVKETAAEEVDYSLNDVALRGWVTTIATERELPSGDLVVQFRIAITPPSGRVIAIRN